MSLQFCSRCLYGSSHPLGIVFDNKGLCSGCKIHEEKDKLDWNERFEKLKKITNEYRSKTKNNYDCIVPVTGAADSYFILHIVKEKLKLNPLLVNYNKYFNTPLGIRNLSNLRMKFDCDILFQNVNPLSVKQITKTSLRKIGSMYWHVLAGHTVFPVQTAVTYKIPLIIWGAHQGLEQVGMFSHLNEVEMTRRYRKDHDLMGYEADDLLSIFDTLKEEHVWQYRYPQDNEINNIGVRGIYLGNYIRWDPKAQHEMMIENYDYKTSSFSRTFDCYDYVDCFNYMDIHDLLKIYKNGFSKVTDHASREIRFGRISRNQGKKLVKKYEMQPLKYLQLFSSWLGVTPQGLQFILNQFRNPLFWDQYKPLNWKFKGWSHINKLEESSSELETKIDFKINGSLEHGKASQYITFGKGHP